VTPGSFPQQPVTDNSVQGVAKSHVLIQGVAKRHVLKLDEFGQCLFHFKRHDCRREDSLAFSLEFGQAPGLSFGCAQRLSSRTPATAGSFFWALDSMVTDVNVNSP
jgi:hypothetical protein